MKCQLSQSIEDCKTYYISIEENLNFIKQYVKGKVFKISKDLPRCLPDGYNYLRNDKRLCIVDSILFDSGEIRATVKVKNKRTKKFDIHIRVYLPLEDYGLIEQGVER